jgi:signal transduction histidine kinase
MAGWRRGRLWHTGPTVLVVLGMAVFVACVYVVVVRGGGAVIGRTDAPSLPLSVLATAIVAIGFQPVARRLRPIAARMVRGGRAAPYQVLTQLPGEVAAGYPTEEIPGQMARLLAEATGGRYAQVWLTLGGTPTLAATWPPGAATGRARPDLGPGRRVLRIRHAGEVLGALVVQERDRHPLTPVETQLFASLAEQAGLMLRSVRLRAELAAKVRESTVRARELRASRERITAAQDEERRRLERDIHDSAQQHLVALGVNLRLARTLVARESPRAPAALADVRVGAVDTIETLTNLSRGIFPRLLSEQGLAAALSAAAAANPLPVEVIVERADAASDDVAATLYFCCLEALQNAAKHSHATRAVVRLSRQPDGASLIVSDDGDGFAVDSAISGRGLLNMRDRVEGVGGSLQISSDRARGTVIAISIPTPGAVP